MIIFQCDRCGKVIAPYVHRIRIETYSNMDYSMDKPVPCMDEVDKTVTEDILPAKVYSMHLCHDCVEQIAAYAMKYNVPELKPIDTEKPKKAPTKARTLKPRKIDKGRIVALYKANWSIHDIADDCGCSEKTVYNYLTEMGLRKGTE